MKKIYIIFFIFSVLLCTKKSEFQKIEEGDFDIVVKGAFHGKTIFLREGGKYRDLVEHFKNEIEINRGVLAKITRQFYFCPESLIYKFKFSMFDEEKNYLVLRYFARLLNHPVIAGYQIQFIFDVESKKLINIYTVEVPFE